VTLTITGRALGLGGLERGLVSSRYHCAMLIAAWILAVATAVLAISGPVALAVWIGARRADAERRQREHEADAADRILQRVKGEYVPKGWVGFGVFVAGIGTLFAIASWSEKRDAERKG
jgi:hypothetical protein